MRRVHLEPEAEAELYEAARWYEARQPGLAVRLFDEIDAAIRAIEDQPNRFPEIPLSFRPGSGGPVEVRRALLQRFPYALVFLVLHDLIPVVAVAHTRRAPAYFRDRVAVLVRGR